MDKLSEIRQRLEAAARSWASMSDAYGYGEVGAEARMHASKAAFDTAVNELCSHLEALARENARLETGTMKELHEVEQHLGKALGYPWYKDDQKNFPGATEADGVCVGEHVAGTIAAEAAATIASLRSSLENECEKSRTYKVWYEQTELARLALQSALTVSQEALEQAMKTVLVQDKHVFNALLNEIKN